MNWHRETLIDLALGLEVDVPIEPQPGYYKRRLVKGGPFIAGEIYFEGERDEAGDLIGDERLVCEIGGIRKDPYEQWTWLANNPISKREYEYMRAVQRHAAWYEPDAPQAHPNRPIDWKKVKLK